MTPALRDKLERLRDNIRAAGPALVAYSGGVDSALVLAIATQELGPARTLACIGISPSYPQRELRHATELARRIGAPIRQVRTDEHLDPNYIANGVDRCYFCKSVLYAHLRRLAAEEGWSAILNGTHADDPGDHVHGMAAAREGNVRSPLLEMEIHKPEVRALARALGLPAWNKPAMACLASRVPRGTFITPELLHRIERAEDALVELGFAQFRVRHHGDLARIELPEADLVRAVQLREQIVTALKTIGYRQVTLDLTPFRQEPDLNCEALVTLQIGHARPTSL